MAVFELASLTYDDVAELDRRELVAILPVGATEAHGPHLPLATDVVIANAMARAGARLLAATGKTAVILPPVAYSVATYAEGFGGTISIRSETATALYVDIGRALAAQRFPLLVVANAHLEPNHIQSLYRAQQQLHDDGKIRVVFPDVTRKPWALRLTEEFKSGACHAGQYEGSIVLSERPEWVKTDVQQALPDNPASLSVAIREGKSSFEDAGGPRAYFGSPSRASAAEGAQTIETLGKILADAVLAEPRD
jgi:creatinine amidohydrolase